MDSSQLQNISEFSSENLTNPEVTPERLAIIKLRETMDLNGHDSVSEAGSRRQSLSFSNGRASSRARSSRHFSTSTQRSSSVRHSHSRFSAELSRQAEGKFFALMDLVATASRDALALKESWSEIIRERNSLSREREELLEQITEVSETLEQRENEYHGHGSELGERKRQIESLIIDLSNALSTISDHKKKATERDQEILRQRNELQDLRDNFSHTSTAHERLKSDVEAAEIRARTAEDERDHARRNSDKYHEQLQSLGREHADLKSKSHETISKLETSRREILSFVERLKVAEADRDEHLTEKERLQELLRKTNTKKDETVYELSELTERYEHQQRDVNRFRETIRDLESERDKISDTVDHLRREIKAKSTTLEEVETQAADTAFKLEHLKKEHLTSRENLKVLELERIEQLETIEKAREETRVITLERNQLKDDSEMWRHRHGDGQRLIASLQETIRKHESTLVELRSEAHTLTDKLSRAERDQVGGRDEHNLLRTEITQLKDKLVIVQGEFRTAIEARDRLREELHQTKLQFEEVTETMTDFRDNSSGYEFEIESLRTMLSDSREQKERAVTARHAADRERDDYIAKYEEKCRELERFEQQAASRFHVQAKEGRNFSSSRTVTRSNTSGTMIRNGHSGESAGEREFANAGNTEL